ncbi:PXA domain-containing protein [Ilyonectria robusta]|uniref:PXA domain-containing protein n=1 Tax=Ilyonectria robusta TaxID=1079257 RepID=UPI001E8E7367|nr:PXA domain-containing protein [Ilyonectria robusta]KAH8737941.1 PXA domain-containing protein [Ilyonectria robusta]
MEPAFRRAASSLCGRCSSSVRRQLVTGTPAKPLIRLSAHHLRSFHGSVSKQHKRTTPEARDFSTSTASKSEAAAASKAPEAPLRLSEDDLFHPFSKSPVPEFRRRAAFMKQHAYCPHPDHQPTKLPTVAQKAEVAETSTGEQAPAHVDFECPDCGLPVYCCEEHWMDDYEKHLEICDTLRQINEDDHDLRSGRVFHEANLPDLQMVESAINMTNWDTFMYTREFDAVNSDRSMRQITRLLTYPVTIGSVLHELSPYSIKDGERLTMEGLKSFSALRYNLHPAKSGLGTDVTQLKPEAPPVRLFILGARAESSLPRPAWVQLAHMFPESRLHLIFVGPESMANRDDEFPLPERTPSNPFGAIVEDRVWYKMKISTIVDYYHTLHQTGHFAPYDPYFDCFVLFHPGLGHPASSHEWEETLPMLLETKVPIISTGYTQFDMERDVEWVKNKSKGEFDILLQPGENKFRSLRWDLNDLDPQDVSAGNWGVWAFRGKRYTPSDSPVMTATTAAAAGPPTRAPVPRPKTASPGPDAPPAAARRSNRPGAADPLSDRATSLLIRRTLCPQQLGDKGRDAPTPIDELLPPLTSRNDMDLQLYAFLAIILREFVQSWYSKITTDENFVAEIIHIIAHCSRALEQRFRKVDLESLLLDEIPDLLDKHITAYRTAHRAMARPPIVADPREVYHALCPLPHLAPVPCPDDPLTVSDQRENEALYRQLLVQGVLAILLPTEDLENPCLTALVEQIFSELIIGNVIANKASQPWLLYEGICITARVLQEKKTKSECTTAANTQPSDARLEVKGGRRWSIRGLFLGLIQLGMLLVGSIRLITMTLVMASSLPPRATPFDEKGVVTDCGNAKDDKSLSGGGPSAFVKAPVLSFRIWACLGNLVEMGSRMPWLDGFLSLLQLGAVHGPGRMAGLDGPVDR